jgi:hypothetical protein
MSKRESGLDWTGSTGGAMKESGVAHHAETIEIATYSLTTGLPGWHDGEERIAIRVARGEVIISANPAGLRGLARELLGLAQEGVPDGNEVYLMSEGHLPLLAVDSPPLRLVRRDG